MLVGGKLSQSARRYLGEKYSLLEAFLLGGTGSPRILYRAGIPTFDPTDESEATKPAFVNIERWKEGLLFRLNRQQFQAAAGIRYADLQRIELIAFRILIVERRLGRITTRMVHRGELTFVDRGGECCSFTVPTRYYTSTLQFFQHSAFQDWFRYAVSLDPPERDVGSIAATLGDNF